MQGSHVNARLGTVAYKAPFEIHYRSIPRGLGFVAISSRAVNIDMTPLQSARRHRPRPLARRALLAFMLGAAAVTSSEIAWATRFANVYYDPATDQLVVTMMYSGTNPNHTFSLKWGRCKAANDGGMAQISANVIDSQWQDAEQNDYQKTTRFNLGKLQCRPAKVTLRSAPRFIYILRIPAPPAEAQQ